MQGPETSSRETVKNLKTNIVSDEMSLPVGYKVSRNGLTLEVKQYKGDRAWCLCSACGLVVPAIDKYTKENLEEWFGKHIELFSSEHREKRIG